MELRVCAADDWPIWRALRLRALAEAPEAFGSTLPEWYGAGDRAERWRSRLSLARSHDLVAVVGGVPAGMASGVVSDDPGVVEIISMWVAPEVRGRGVARGLIAAIEAWAGAGATELRLAVMPGNAAAIALYERAGFRMTDEPGDPLGACGGHELVMAKAIGRTP